MAGRNIKINQMSSGLPDVSDVLNGWEIPITANYVTQQVVDGIVTDVAMKKFIKGLKQPLKPEDVALKDEGQRSWSWNQIHIRESLYGELFTTQILTINGVNYKIKIPSGFRRIYGHFTQYKNGDWLLKPLDMICDLTRYLELIFSFQTCNEMASLGKNYNLLKR